MKPSCLSPCIPEPVVAGLSAPESPHPAKSLLDIFHAALTRVNGQNVVQTTLPSLIGTEEPVKLVAIGKAAMAMTRGALNVLGEQIRAGLVITKSGHGGLFDANLPIRVWESAHPVPDASSLEAGALLLDFLHARPDCIGNKKFLFLISGGASSLVECLPEQVTLADLQRVNAWLLGSGLEIHHMNRIRKCLSRIKGGRLMTHLGGVPATALLLSDVPGDHPGTIGSGLLVSEEAQALPETLPGWLHVLLAQTPPWPRPEDTLSPHVDLHVVGRNTDALRAAGERAAALGFPVRKADGTLAGDAVEQGRLLADELLRGEPGIYLWGGETTVTLPPSPGKGGRNQSLALAAAREIQGRDDLFILAAGTDGSDGPGSWAGALVDGKTIARGRRAGLDPEISLLQADAQTFLTASKDLLQTGPTGTNVMDMVIGLRQPSRIKRLDTGRAAWTRMGNCSAPLQGKLGHESLCQGFAPNPARALPWT
ncbi:MAG: DUF4147 domain-containing protein, partial [Magnetococcales bacterium]|nr:DUF4147 domain-containing protein [Magnetococcales bacterium]